MSALHACKYHKYMCDYALVSMSVRASVHSLSVCQCMHGGACVRVYVCGGASTQTHTYTEREGEGGRERESVCVCRGRVRSEE